MSHDKRGKLNSSRQIIYLYLHSENQDGDVSVEADQGDKVDDVQDPPDKRPLVGAAEEPDGQLQREEGVADEVNDLKLPELLHILQLQLRGPGIQLRRVGTLL